MARSTPTYTPIRNYAIGILLSAILLFSDIAYGTFTPVRGFVNASALYAKMISSRTLENISNTFYSFKKNRNLLNENKELKEQILQIRTKDFIERKNRDEKKKIINFQKELISSLNNNYIDIYKIASMDLRNYFCCSTHRIFLQNTKNASIEKNVPVFAGNSYIGQTKNTYIDFIEVILFSDGSHVLPIKSNSFYCDARGKGKPLLISCTLDQTNQDFPNQIGDLIYTSGLGGIFFKDIEIGFISGVNAVSKNEIEVLITLKANPLNETFYAVLSKEADEV